MKKSISKITILKEGSVFLVAAILVLTSVVIVPITIAQVLEHDVGVTVIISPTSGPSQTYPVKVIVENFGNNSETSVPVNVAIEEFITDPNNGTLIYEDTSFIDINAGESMNVSFPDCYLTEIGKYEVTACTQLEDENPNNDCLTVVIYISPLKVNTNRFTYLSEEKIAITIENSGDTPVYFPVFPGIEILNEQGDMVYPSYIEKGNWSLSPGEKETYIWDQKDLNGDYVICPGNYTIKTTNFGINIISILQIYSSGCVILIGGDVPSYDDRYPDTRCYYATKWIYNKLIQTGFTDESILFLSEYGKSIDSKVDYIASVQKVKYAIEVWAKNVQQVGWGKPLYIIMWDHGGGGPPYIFGVGNNAGEGNLINSYDLRSWIDSLYSNTKTKTHVWMMACHSGGFIPDLSRSRSGNKTVTSTCADLLTWLTDDVPYEVFTKCFWEKIPYACSWLDAFNYGCYYSHQFDNENTPLLDDNGDEDGHGLWTCDDGSYQGNLPHHGDGEFAKYNIMTPWIAVKQVELKYISIPPARYWFKGRTTESIPFWAVIDSDVPLTNVSAGILDPNWPPENCSCLEEFPCKYFEMNDPDHDGNWTVNIPVSEFNKYPNATDFKILISAENEDGETAEPLITSVYFRNATPDSELPFVSIYYPIDGQIVGEGVLNITGSASDNIALEKIELYINDILFETITPPSSSHYYFSYSIPITIEGDLIFNVVGYDSSGNDFTQLVKVIAVGTPLTPNKPDGPGTGKVRIEYTYTTSTSEPQGNKVFYMWDWGDNTTSGWLGPYNSSERASGKHIWNKRGTYQIKVKAKDVYGAESDWSDPLSVKMPKKRALFTTHPIMSWLFEHFQQVFPILSLLMRQ